jgi:methionyl-tRNA formyltransferase
MRIVFCGTPQFAVPTLAALLDQRDIEIAAVITQPDRPRGRGQDVAASPVKQAALAAGLAVHQPEKIRSPDAQKILEQIAPDCIVIIAYGQIIPARLLPIPKFGWINLHASLLPKYRGAAPINWAIVNGESETGLTTMRIDAGMDTGEMLLQSRLRIGPLETAPELTTRLAEAGAPLMIETLRGIAAGTLESRPQNNEEASTAPILKREDGRIDWRLPAQPIYNRMRGFTPWPGAYSFFRSQNCQIGGQPVFADSPLAVQFKQAALAPGTIRKTGDHLLVACGDTTVFEVTAVKVEGRKQNSATEFANGARLTEGERFGDS